MGSASSFNRCCKLVVGFGVDTHKDSTPLRFRVTMTKGMRKSHGWCLLLLYVIFSSSNCTRTFHYENREYRGWTPTSLPTRKAPPFGSHMMLNERKIVCMRTHAITPPSLSHQIVSSASDAHHMVPQRIHQPQAILPS